MIARCNSGFTMIELLISMAILAILAAVTVPSLIQARGQANNAAAKGYLRHVVNGVEIERTTGKFVVPKAQSCALLAGKPADPASVSNCTYTPAASQDSYTVMVESIAGETYRYDGAQISVLP